MENIADSTSKDSSKYLILRLYHIQHHTVANHQLIFLCLHMGVKILLQKPELCSQKIRTTSHAERQEFNQPKWDSSRTASDHPLQTGRCKTQGAYIQFAPAETASKYIMFAYLFCG